MMPEQEFFLKILSDFLLCQKSQRVDGINWDTIAFYSKIHQVTGIIYYQCKSFIPESYQKIFDSAFCATFFCYMNRENMQEIIRQSFDNEKIQYFFIKGTEISKYYQIPALRTMGDSDIIIHEQQKVQTIKILEQLGFHYEHEYAEKESCYSWNGNQVELHHQLIYDEIVTVPEQKEFFNNCWIYVKDDKLDTSFQFIYLISHLRKHLMNEGAGFRQFMDIALMAKNEPLLDWEWIKNELEKLKLLQFAQVCCGLIEKWFGIEMLIPYQKVDDEFLSSATEKIFRNGVFGFADQSNEENIIVNWMMGFKGPSWLSRIVLIFKHIFPNYEFLRLGKAYKFLDGHPFLLPIAWIKRIFMMICGKTISVPEVLRQIMLSNNEIKNRENEMKKWGLSI